MASVPLVDYFIEPFPAATRGNRFGVKGPFYGPQGHRGQDWVQPCGAGIKAVANGIVTAVFWSDVLGNVTVIRHVWADGAVLYSGTCHQSSRLVRVGQIVKRGQIIGRVGTTGSASTGCHDHMTFSRYSYGVTYGDVLNPLDYIAAHGQKKALPATVATKAKYTVARRGEGLAAIAARMKISLARIKTLNPNITGPEYVVDLGKRIRYV